MLHSMQRRSPSNRPVGYGACRQRFRTNKEFFDGLKFGPRTQKPLINAQSQHSLAVYFLYCCEQNECATDSEGPTCRLTRERGAASGAHNLGVQRLCMVQQGEEPGQ